MNNWCLEFRIWNCAKKGEQLGAVYLPNKGKEATRQFLAETLQNRCFLKIGIEQLFNKNYLIDVFLISFISMNWYIVKASLYGWLKQAKVKNKFYHRFIEQRFVKAEIIL